MTRAQATPQPKPLSARKFTAKLLSTPALTPEQKAAREQDKKAAENYASLMERSFGKAIHSESEAPPAPTESEFLISGEKQDEK